MLNKFISDKPYKLDWRVCTTCHKIQDYSDDPKDDNKWFATGMTRAEIERCFGERVSDWHCPECVKPLHITIENYTAMLNRQDSVDREKMQNAIKTWLKERGEG